MSFEFDFGDFDISFRYPKNKEGKYVETPYLCGYSGTAKELTLPKNLSEFCADLDAPICEMEACLLSSEASEALEILTIPGSYQKIKGFGGSAALKRVAMSAPTSTIESRAFYDCKRLEEVTFSDSLETIEGDAFANCLSLRSVELPSSLKYIGRGAFRACSLLEKIALPEGVTVIDNGAFQDCVRLCEVVLPKSTSRIGTYAFKNCKSLKKVYIKAEHAVKMEMGVFSGVPSGLEVVFSGNREEWYKSLERIVIDPEYPTMYGEPGSVTVEHPLGHPLTSRFEVKVFCEGDGAELICTGHSESTEHICH